MDTGDTEFGAVLDATGSNDLTALFEQSGAIPDDIEWIELVPGADTPSIDGGIAGLGVRALRKDYANTFVDLEPYLAHPRRTRANVHLFDSASFVDYVNRFAFAPDAKPVVYIDRDKATAEVIVDDHTADHPGWRDHTGVLTWQRTPEWKRWLTSDRRMMGQEPFAELIEDGLSEIVEPDAADLLEVAQTIKATMTANITSARYLRDGTVKIHWDEELDAKGGRSGDMDIPQGIVLRVAPFESGTPVEVKARLRYKLDGRKLLLGYILDRPRDVEHTALDAEISLLRSGLADTVLLLMGHPG